ADDHDNPPLQRSPYTSKLARVGSDRVANLGAVLGVGRPGAVRAAEELPADLDTVSHDLDVAVLADRRQAVHRALERVEDVHMAADGTDLEAEPVLVPTDLTS